MVGVVVESTRLLLINIDGVISAFEDRCAHQAVELSRGTLEGHTLTCWAHEWQYDARTGLSTNPRGRQLKRYAVKIEDDAILVDLAHDEEP
jgi:toluene monooxygenase system ferredoxin subunit